MQIEHDTQIIIQVTKFKNSLLDGFYVRLKFDHKSSGIPECGHTESSFPETCFSKNIVLWY